MRVRGGEVSSPRLPCISSLSPGALESREGDGSVFGARCSGGVAVVCEGMPPVFVDVGALGPSPGAVLVLF